MPRPKLFSRRQRKEKPPPFEELIVFDDDEQSIYRVSLPAPELLERFGRASRYVPDTTMPRYVGAVIAMAATWLTASQVFYWVLILPMANSMVFGVLLSFWMALPGWMIGPKFGPKPQWLARRVDGKFASLNPYEYFAPDHPEASFAAEMLELRDVRLIMQGGRTKQQKMILTTLIILLGSLIAAFFFMIVIFSTN